LKSEEVVSFLTQAKRLASLTLASSLLGFIRELVIAHRFGATHGTDSYLVALSIPSMFFAFLVGSGLNYSVVPRMTSLLERDPKHGMEAYTEFYGALLSFGLGASVLIFLFAPQLLRGFAPGLASSHLTVLYARFLSPMLFLFTATYSLASFQCARHKTAYWGLVAPTMNAVVLISIPLLAGVLGVGVLVLGTLAGVFLALLTQVYLAQKAGLWQYWTRPWRGGEGTRMLRALLPFVLVFGIGGSDGTSQVDIFLARFFASHLNSGSITLLSLANKLTALPVLLVGASMGLAVLPGASLAFGKRDNAQAASHLVQALGYVLLLIAPVYVLCLSCSGVLARLVFSRGAMRPEQVAELGSILVAYSGAVLGAALIYVLSGFLAAHGRTKLLIGWGVTTVILEAGLMRFFSERYAARGIAWAMSIGSLFYCCVLSLALLRSFGMRVTAEIGKRVFVVLTGALAMFLVLRLTSQFVWFETAPYWLSKILFPVLSGVASYGIWLALWASFGLRVASPATRQTLRPFPEAGL
jgi:putative peptidoglycan lipid II flippase